MWSTLSAGFQIVQDKLDHVLEDASGQVCVCVCVCVCVGVGVCGCVWVWVGGWVGGGVSLLMPFNNYVKLHKIANQHPKRATWQV